MSKIENINHYQFNGEACFFFDNNVWIYILCSMGDTHAHKQKDYSNFLKQIRDQRATIHINSILLSEFANTCLRFDFNLWKKKQKYGADYKKNYLKSSRYQEAVKVVTANISTILQLTKRLPDNLNSIDLDKVLSHFQDIDFNDSYYIEFCKSAPTPLILVTDDRDFNTTNCAGLTILTSQTN